MSDKNIKLPSGITPELAELARANPGEVVSNTPRLSTEPRAHIPISGYGTNITPRVKGQEDAPRVTAPNISRFNKADADRRLAEIEAKEAAIKERESLQGVLDPVKLNAVIQSLSRKVARLEKQLKEQAKHDT